MAGWSTSRPTGKDKAGAAINYVVDGKIENLAMHNRSVTGTWKSQRG